MTAWIGKHKATAILLGLVLVWVAYRVFRGSISSGGHATPDDAISDGWMVYPAGIGGWLEVSPDGTTQYLHESGYTGDPYSRL